MSMRKVPIRRDIELPASEAFNKRLARIHHQLATTPCSRSIQLLRDRSEGSARERVFRLDLERAHELLLRLPEEALRPVDVSEVAVRVVAWLVARGDDRALEPRDRLVQIAALDQVGADVVVRVPEVGIDGDRLLALRDRLVDAAWKLYVQPRKVCASAVGWSAIDCR